MRNFNLNRVMKRFAILLSICILAACSAKTEIPMTISKKNLNLDDKNALEKVFDKLDSHPIACCNWPDQAPYCPEVSFKAFHTGEYFVIRYYVKEDSYMAEAANDGGRVWEDSCVEFFISPQGDGAYYNFETNCIGTIHLAHRSPGVRSQMASEQTYASIKRFPSLGTEPFSLKEEPVEWTMTLFVPAIALYADDIDSWSGLHCKMNFYKCGDRLAQKHFLSWAPIQAERPNFHLPEFFADVEFEK